MAEDKELAANEIAIIELKNFLETAPPTTVIKIEHLHLVQNGGSYGVDLPILDLRCSNCDKVTIFESSDDLYIAKGAAVRNYVYRCRNCRSINKYYSVISYFVEGGVHLDKVGEVPRYGELLPDNLLSLAGEDRGLLIKGYSAEKLGLGIGAFAYYRRVVENQKNRLIERIEKLSIDNAGSEDYKASILKAKAETQFTNAIESIKRFIPDSLRINGENPLILLHDVMSNHVHGSTDEECLADAQIIRTVLAALASRIEELLKEDKELLAAVKALRAKTNTTKKNFTNAAPKKD